MAYQFTQTGAEIQDILNQVGDNTSDISSLDTRLTTAEGEISSLNQSLVNIGTMVTASNGSAVTVTRASYQSVVSATLSAGTWIVFGKVRFNGHPAASFSTLAALATDPTAPSVNNNAFYPTQDSAAHDTGFIGMVSVAMFKISSAATIHMVLYQDSANSVTVRANQSSIAAMRIA